VIHDALNDPRANADLARRWKIVSTIVVPLMATIALGTSDRGTQRAICLSEGEVQLTSALAGQAAVAIESASSTGRRRSAAAAPAAQYNMMRAERLAAVGTLASSLATR